MPAMPAAAIRQWLNGQKTMDNNAALTAGQGIREMKACRLLAV